MLSSCGNGEEEKDWERMPVVEFGVVDVVSVLGEGNGGWSRRWSEGVEG